MTFKEPPKEFGPSGDVQSPYMKQLASLERRAESERTNTASWRLIAFIASGVALVATGGLFYIGKSQPIPAVHVVQVDKETGEPVRHEVLGEPVKVTDAMIRNVIGRWMQWTRGKSIDPVVIADNWDRAYQFVPPAAKQKIDVYAREVDAFNREKIGEEAITVQIASVTRQSEDTFQVRWHETVFRKGSQIGRETFTANVSVDFLKPTSPRQIQINPLGVMITQIYVQPDFVAVEQAS